MNELREKILQALRESQKATTGHIAFITETPSSEVQVEMERMLEEWLITVDGLAERPWPYTPGGQPAIAYKLVEEKIGDCEICGLVDHHLREGVCAGCQAKCRTATSSQAPAHDDVRVVGDIEELYRFAVGGSR